MKYLRPLVVFWLAVMFAAGCSDGGTEVDAITVNDLVGSWTATSVVHTNNANSAEQFGLIANGGETRITVLQGGGVRTWVELGTFSDEWDAQLAIDGNTLTSTPVEAVRGVRTYTFTLEGNLLTLTNANASFDFTLSDATEVSTTEVTALVRR